MNDITVIDNMMGKGKTSWAIQNITLYNRMDKFIYVTPYLDEVDRITSACKEHLIEVSSPSNVGGGKSEHFKQLISRGKNIVTTHALFDRVDVECLDLLRSQGYILYLDEVHEVVRRVVLTKDDLTMLMNYNCIEIDKVTGKVDWVAEDYVGKFEEFRNLCELGSMYKYSDYVYVWCFPAEIFKAMKHTYVLTYYFEGQVQSYYYRLHGLDYKMKNVYTDGGLYKIKDYNAEESTQDIRNVIGKIGLYEGNLNYEGGVTLSTSWFERADKSAQGLVKNNLQNWFTNVVRGNTNDNMWTSLKASRKHLKGKGYTKGFVPLNARATNKYKHKRNVAYIYNRYLNPVEKAFFKGHGIQVNEDLYALSELLQWVFRSQIRESKEINLYLPSKRMRNIYKDWLKLNEYSYNN
ncbi:MAG: hypothetical protein ACRC5T_08570 [Cetobacterium sp.]